jgi:hypothetical protein
MAGEVDQTLHTVDKPAADGGKSDALVTSSSATIDAIKMADQFTPNMSD